MLGKWRKSVDNGKVFGGLLTDLSKALKISSTSAKIKNMHMVLAYGSK